MPACLASADCVSPLSSRHFLNVSEIFIDSFQLVNGLAALVGAEKPPNDLRKIRGQFDAI